MGGLRAPQTSTHVGVAASVCTLPSSASRGLAVMNQRVRQSGISVSDRQLLFLLLLLLLYMVICMATSRYNIANSDSSIRDTYIFAPFLLLQLKS